MKLIDTHLHLWNINEFSLPWLDGEGSVLKRNYSINDYSKDMAAGSDYEIEKAVYVEVDSADFEKERENQYALNLCRDSSNMVSAAIISGDLTKDQFKEYINVYRDIPQVKGVRQVLHVPSVKPGTCLSGQFIENVRYLGENDFLFEGCLRNEELHDLYQMAKQCPDTMIVLDHMGIADPDIISKPAPDAEELAYKRQWIKNLTLLAGLEHVVCKISGLNPAGEWNVDTLRPAVDIALDIFGEDRVMFASNYPVCNIATGLSPWIKSLDEITRERGEEFQKKLFYNNAKRIYHL